MTDRDVLLEEAARRVTALAGHLGAPEEGPPEDGPPREYADLLRSLKEDQVAFGPYPQVFPLDVADLPEGTSVAQEWRHILDQGFRFTQVLLPISLFPARNWAFTRLETAVEFNPGQADPGRPTAYDILPNRRFDTVMHAGAELSVRVGGDGRFAVDVGELAAGVPLGLKAEAGAKGEVELGGTFRFKAVAGRVDHSAIGMSQVNWRLDGAEFFRETEPQLAVILQIPKAVDGVELRCVLRAYRRFSLFPAGLQGLIRELPRALRTFFTGGAPVERWRTYRWDRP